MGRPHRFDPPDGWHHIMNRGVDRGAIFFDDDDRKEFGRLLGLVHERFGIEIHAYCLMGNHYHLLVRCPDGGLSQAMHLFASLFVRFVNDRIDRDGPLFKSRFHARPITTVAHLANALRYIHLNPLDIAGIEQPSDYRWSSHRTYLRLRPTPHWLNVDYFMAWFGGDPSTIDAFVTGANESDHRLDCSADDLIDACAFIVAEQSTVRLRSRHAEARALMLAVADGADDALQDAVYTTSGLSGGALRTAQTRSRQLFADRPGLIRLRSAVEVLLAA